MEEALKCCLAAVEPPSWSFKLWGKLLEATDGTPKSGTKQQQQPPPMTSLVRRMEVHMEGDVAEGSTHITWEKELHDEPHCDHFLIE